jgi:protease-4
MQATSSPIKRFFLGIWRFIDGTRKLVLNLIFLLILYFVIVAVMETGETLIIEPETSLLLQPQGDVVEQYSGTALDYAIQQAAGTGRTETRLRDLVKAVRLAADDRRIVQLVIDTTYLGGIGMAALQELEAAVADFKLTGKPVVALAENLGQGQYYLAALADEIWLNPKGMVWIDGFAAYRQYYGEGLDKLEVEVNLFRAGKYKSAGEPWVRSDMSPEAREANLYWIGSLWQQYLEGVSRLRGIPLETLSGAVNQFPDLLEAADGDFARMALDMGLVDKLLSRPEANLALAQTGAPGNGNSDFRQVGVDSYLALNDIKGLSKSDSRVVVVVAEGEIVRGDQPQGLVGAITLSEKLRDLAEDDSARAVVLRVNSPGGDAFASEKIRRQMQALKESGKTVVVSMGNVAASGGYWIAMGADEVWASPTTITGSIGVYGILPTFARPLEKLGIRSDGVGTTSMAGKLRLDRPLDPGLRRIFQQSTERVYADFVDLVAENRNRDRDEILAVAQGRVWSGVQAKERGLIDQTGTLREAADAAARIAGLGADYRMVYDERELSPLESFLIDMTSNVLLRLDFARPDSILNHSLLEQITDDLSLLLRSNGELTIAAHCLCASD